MKNLSAFIVLILTITLQQLQAQQSSLNQLLIQEEYSTIISQLKNKPHLTENEIITLAVSYKQTGHPIDAIKLIENTKADGNKDIKKLLPALYFETGNYDMALPLIKTIFEKNQNNYANFIRYVDILTFNKEYLDAIEILNERYKTDTLNFEINKRLAENYTKIDSTSKAIKHYSLLFNRYPTNQVVAYRLARLYSSSKTYRKSLNVCDTILKYSPENKRFLSLKGSVYFRVNQYRNAIIVMTKLEKLGDNSFITQRILGISYYKKDDFIEAANYLKKALEWKPDDAIVNYYLGASLSMLPVPEDGLPYLKDAIELLLPPSNVMEKIHYSMANIYHKSQEFNLAIDNYKKALNYDPKQVQYILNIATIYDLELKNNKVALKYYEKFISSLPEKLDTKKGKERYAINLKKYAERRITKIKEDNFFNSATN